MRKLMHTMVIDEEGEAVTIRTPHGAKVIAQRRVAGRIARQSRKRSQQREALARRLRQKRRDRRRAR